MSNKSSTSSQVISLPQGGGAQRGIGEKFSPDLHTGTGNFTVPIALPPGRNGFQPELSLVYSTGNGNGVFGLGWRLSVPGVSRKTSKGVPVYDDSKDTFILSGAEDLVPVPGGSPGMSRYRPRTEGLFARIHHHRDGQNDYWEVRSKDGLASLYGTPQAARNDPAVIADDRDHSRVFAWTLTRTTDPFGNRIEYQYERDSTRIAGSHHWDQLYLSQIRYIDYGDPTNPQFLVTVNFIYEGRPDPFSDYRAGFEIRTVKRCVRLEISTHAGADTLTRAYQFGYLDQANLPPGRSPLNAASLLSQVRVEGYDGPRSEALPPLEFTYTVFQPRLARYQPFSGVSNSMPGRSLAQGDYELVDLFGNGLPDVLQMNGTVRYWRNLGGGVFDLPRTMQHAPAGVRLQDVGVQLADLNGDGRTDLLVTDGVRGGYYSLTFQGGWDQRSFVRYRQVPTVNLEDPNVRLMDLTGDGITDALRTGPHFELYYNDRDTGWTNVELRPRRGLEEFPNVSFSDPRVKLGDMTGDGLQDIVLIHSGRIDYWPYLGYGRWGRRITMSTSPRFEDALLYSGVGYDPRRVLLGDVDGDGFADLVYVGSGHVTVWINQSGNGWGEPITVQGTPPVTNMDAVRLADMIGTGTAGILWTNDYHATVDSTYKFLDLTGGVKPYLLNQMDNHTGAVTRVAYAPSTQFYREDEKRPISRWKSPLPFPVQVVSRVEVIDQISQGKLTTEYAYHHGYWDGAEREFRGFGRVDQRDTETFEDYSGVGLHAERAFAPVALQQFSPPIETRTWFHQGPVGEEFGEWEEPNFSQEFWPGDAPVLVRSVEMVAFLRTLPRRSRRDALRTLRGSVLRTEVYALDGTERQARPYTVTESLYGLREEAVPGPEEANRLRIFFPHLLAQRTTQWERGDDPMPRFTFTDSYDEYGQPRSQISIAVPRGRKYLETISPGSPAPEPYLATHTLTDYAQGEDNSRYIVSRVARTTAYEIANDGRDGLFVLKGKIEGRALDSEGAVISQTVNFYDRDLAQPDHGAFFGLPFGQIGDYGAVVRTERLALTDDLLLRAYGGDPPPYLVDDGTGVRWTADYPPGFRTRLPALAGYTHQAGGGGPEYAVGYFAKTGGRYDFHDDPGGKGRGLLKSSRDPLGHETTIAYDPFALRPTEATDAAGLKTKVTYDYRVLQPRGVTGPNGNRTVFAFTPLGLLERAAVMGKNGEPVGDTVDAPGTRLIYDFLAFLERKKPVSVRTIRRVHHVNETDVALPERDDTITTIEYSDGFGRLLQTRTQAEDIVFGSLPFGNGVLPANQSDPGRDAVGHRLADPAQPQVVVTGWQVYDNKGRVVEKYEPFFSTTWDFAPPADVQFGQKAAMFYDPLGRLIRTLNPDGSEQRVLYGVPDALIDPERFTPTPWETYTYDANDNAGRTHPGASTGYQQHWNTPSSIVLDALGRTVAAVARNGSAPATNWYTTRSTYDIRGNPLNVTDPLARVAFMHVYDLADRPLLINSMDAGSRRNVLDATGNVVERRDSKGAIVLRTYDLLNRANRVWARDGTGQPLTLREKLVYGDSPDSGLTLTEAIAANLLAKLYEHYDEAGLLTLASYDFKANVLEKRRRVIADAAILAVFTPPPPNWEIRAFRVDWEYPDSTPLDPTDYETTLAYDALNRVKAMQYPRDVTGTRQMLRPHHNRAGALERLELDDTVYVERIAYNAKGQRTLIAYGNGVMTRHAYDDQTFRLIRLRTEHYTTPADLTYHPTGASLQDFAYEYDPVGNILKISDRTPGSGIPNTQLGIDALDRVFTYDPIYRLRAGTGRECDAPASALPWDDALRCSDPTRTRAYAQLFLYDPIGNLIELRHQATNGNFTREFAMTPTSNHLFRMVVSETSYAYGFDSTGNLLTENGARHFEWDHSDRMRVYRTQSEGAEPSTHANYLYDGGGQRVIKLVRKQGGAHETTLYIDNAFEHHRWSGAGEAKENNRLQVMDNHGCVAVQRVGDSESNDGGPDVQYHAGDHLGSSNVVIGRSGASISREEYFLYGETSFGSFAKKRYRFTGQERDEENGLYYHGARYYAPWVARWVSCDPPRYRAGTQQYRYAFNNPLRFSDADGNFPVPYEMAETWAKSGLEPIPGLTGERISQAASEFGVKIGGAIINLVPPDSLAGIFTATVVKSVVEVAGGLVAASADPAFLIRGVLRFGTGVAQGVNDIEAGNTVLGVSRMVAEASQAVGIAAGAVWTARILSVPGTSQLTTYPASTASEGRVLNIGGELESMPGDIVLNRPTTTQVPLETIARETGAKIIAGQAEAIPVKSGSMSEVQAHNLPPNTIDWQAAAPEISRVLKPGGTVDISVRGGEAPTIARSLESQGIRATVDPMSLETRVTGVKSK